VLQNPKLAKDGLLTTSQAKTGDDCAKTTWLEEKSKKQTREKKRKTETLGTLFWEQNEAIQMLKKGGQTSPVLYRKRKRVLLIINNYKRRKRKKAETLFSSSP
jgi:hypothetical protein